MTHYSRITPRPNSEDWLDSLCNFDHLAGCSAEGEQEVPSQNMPFRCKNYFKLKTSEIQQMQKGGFVELSLSDLKAEIPGKSVYHKFPRWGAYVPRAENQE